MGIYLVCKALYDANFAEDDADTEHEVKRTPAVFLLPYGEANWGSANYAGNLGTPNVENGSSSNAKRFAANVIEATKKYNTRLTK